MGRKNAHYFEFRFADWLTGQISYEKNSIKLAWVTLKCLCFQMEIEERVLTKQMALKHKGITYKALNHLIENNYLKIENGIIKDEEIIDNASKVCDTSNIQRIKASIRWKKDEIKRKKERKILTQLLQKCNLILCLQKCRANREKRTRNKYAVAYALAMP